MALVILISLEGCFASPTYWAFDPLSNVKTDEMPIMAQRGWKDGCRSSYVHWARPSVMRYLGAFYMNPDLVNDPMYRDAWYFGNYNCSLRFGYSANKNFLGPTNYLDARGDYIQYKK